MLGATIISIGGQERPLKFGTNATFLFCQKRGITLKQFGEVFAADKLANNDIDGSEIRDLIWAGLVAGAKSNNLPVDFDEWTVGDWIDDLSAADMGNVLSTFGEDVPTKKKTVKAK